MNNTFFVSGSYQLAKFLLFCVLVDCKTLTILLELDIVFENPVPVDKTVIEFLKSSFAFIVTLYKMEIIAV